MKRLTPEARKQIIRVTYDRLAQDWLCRYGAWNAAKLLKELKRELKNGQRKD